MKRLILILLAVVLLAGALVLFLPKKGTPTWQEQYDLGVRYLSEGNYEEAIIAFNAAIEIDPRREDAYLAMADVYIEQKSYDEALSVLNQGIANAGNTAILLDKLDATKAMLLQSQNESNSAANSGINPNPATEVWQTIQPNLILSNVEYWYHSGGEITIHNQEAIGGVCTEFRVDGPAEVVFADIEVVPVATPIDDVIRDMFFSNRSGIEPISGTLDWGIEMPIFPWAANTKMTVIVLGYNSSGELISYAIAGTVEIGDREIGDHNDSEMTKYMDSQKLTESLRSGLLTFDDVPELFFTPFDKLASNIGLEASSDIRTMNQSGSVNGIQYENLEVQWCWYDSNHSGVSLSSEAPVGKSTLLEFTVNASNLIHQDEEKIPAIPVGWRGICTGDDLCTVLEKLGIDSSLGSYVDVDIGICREMNLSFGQVDTEAHAFSGLLGEISRISVSFLHKRDDGTIDQGMYSILLDFLPGGPLYKAHFVNLTALASYASSAN